MTLIWFLGVTLLIAYHVRESNAGAEEVGDNPEDTNLEESVVRAAKGGLKLEISIECACVEGLEKRRPELYLIGQVLYYPDTDTSNTEAKEGERFQTKVVNEDRDTAYFRNILIIKNETNKFKIGVYLDVWDEDYTYDDYLGSVTIRYFGQIAGTDLEKKRSKFYPDYRPKLERCPEEKYYPCRGSSARVYLHLLHA